MTLKVTANKLPVNSLDGTETYKVLEGLTFPADMKISALFKSTLSPSG